MEKPLEEIKEDKIQWQNICVLICLGLGITVIVTFGIAGIKVFWKSGISRSNIDDRVDVLLGIDDTYATVGKLFEHKIHNNAFQGQISTIKAKSMDTTSLPSWLWFNQDTQTFLGVPTITDIGAYMIEVVVSSYTSQAATTSFLIQVRPPSQQTTENNLFSEYPSRNLVCDWDQQTIKASLLLDTSIKDVNPKERAEVIQKWSNHLSQSVHSLSLVPRSGGIFNKLDNTKILIAGPGDANPRTKNEGVQLSWTIACGDFSENTEVETVLTHNIKSGSIKNVLGFDVIGWYVTENMPVGGPEVLRKKRQATAFRTPIPTPTISVRPTATSSIAPSSTVSIVSSISPTASSSITVITPTSTATISITSPSITSQINKTESATTETPSLPVSPTVINTTPIVIKQNTTVSSVNVSTTSSAFTNVTSQTTDSAINNGTTLVASTIKVATNTSLPVTTEVNVNFTTPLISNVTTPTVSNVTTASISNVTMSSIINVTSPLIGNVTTDSTILNVTAPGTAEDFNSTVLVGNRTSNGTTVQFSNVTLDLNVTTPMYSNITTEVIATTQSPINVTAVSETTIVVDNVTEALNATTASINNVTISATVSENVTASVTTPPTENVTSAINGTIFITDSVSSIPTVDTVVNITTENQNVTTPTENVTTVETSVPTTHRKDFNTTAIPSVTVNGTTSEITTASVVNTTFITNITTGLSTLSTSKTDFTTVASNLTTKQMSTEMTSIVVDVTTVKDQTTQQLTTPFLNLTTGSDQSTAQVITTDSLTSEKSKITTRSVEITTQQLTTPVLNLTTGSDRSTVQVITTDSLTSVKSKITTRSVEITSEGLSTNGTFTPRVSTGITSSITTPFESTVVTQDNNQTTAKVTTDAVTTGQSQITTISSGVPTSSVSTKTETAPVVSIGIPAITTYLGTYFEFIVPGNTFSDQQDGLTRNLSLQLFLAAKQPLSKDYWVQFNQSAQIIYGLPLQNDYASMKGLPHTLVLTATDSSGLGISTVVTLIINNTLVTNASFAFYIDILLNSLIIGNNQVLPYSTEDIIYLVKQIAMYFGDTSSKFISLLEISNKNNNSMIVKWTNNSISQVVCQNDTILQLYNKISKPSELAKLRRLLLPKFAINSSGMEWMGVCVNATGPLGETGSDMTVIIAVIIAILIIILIIILVICFICYRRKKKQTAGRYMPDDEKPIFSNNRKPIILEGEIDIKDPTAKPRKPVFMEVDTDPAFAYSNPGYSGPEPNKRKPPSYISKPNLKEAPPALGAAANTHPDEPVPYSGEMSAPYDFEPFNRHTSPPPPYRIPPPYIENPGYSQI